MTRSQTETRGPEDPIPALVAGARAGSRQALEELVELHLPLLYNIIGRALNGHADVDDLVQDTMLRIIRGLPALHEPGRFRSWAVAIAYRQVQQHRRRLGRTPQHHHEAAEPVDPRADFAERAVAELLLTGQRREVAEASRWLEPADRHLLSLWWMEAAGRLTRTELAEALGVPAARAAVQVQRLRTRLGDARAVVRSLEATPRCPDLAELVRPWAGTPDRLWRKRIGRHVRDCPGCGGHRRGLVPPEQLLLGTGLVPVPVALAGLTGQVLPAAGHTAATAAATATSAPHGFTGLTHHLTGGKIAAAVTVTALTAGGLGYARWDSAHPPGRSVTDAPRVSASHTRAPATSAPAASGPTPTPRATFAGVHSADVYVAPDGSDDGDGSLTHPFATLARAASTVRPGQTIALRGGTYTPGDTTTLGVSGTVAARITVSGYRNERPVIDGSGLDAGRWTLVVTGSHLTVQGLEIRNSPSHALVCSSCRHDVFRRLSLHGNGTGLTLRDADTVDNTVADSDFYDNHSADGTAGTGLAVMFGSGTGNVVRGCRSYRNAVEGVDLGGFADPVTLVDNWSFGNDSSRWGARNPRVGNGFTLGGGHTVRAVAHVLRDNAAWDNAGIGFNDESNPGAIRLTRNTAYRNGAVGFFLPAASAVARGNVAVGNRTDATQGTAVRSNGNTWDAPAPATTARFVSTDPASAQGGRRTDGRLPRTTFLVSRDGRGADMAD